MGVKDLFKLRIDKATIFKDLKHEFDIKDKNICIDSSCIVYKYFYSTLDKNSTSDKNIKSYKKFILAFVQELIINNVNAIWVFDGERNIYKLITTLKRKKMYNDLLLKEIKNTITKTNILEKSSDITLDDIKIINKNLDLTFEYNNTTYTCLNITPLKIHFDILKNILKTFGINYVIADYLEAEHLAVKICKDYNYQGVLSADSDVLMFNGNLITLNNLDDKNSIRYYIYYIDEILGKLNITKEDFCKMCIMLGCDFCEKTKGIGCERALKKYNTLSLTVDQEPIYKYILDEIGTEYNIICVDSMLPNILYNVFKEYKEYYENYIYMKLLVNNEYYLENVNVYNGNKFNVYIMVDELDDNEIKVDKLNEIDELDDNEIKLDELDDNEIKAHAACGIVEADELNEVDELTDNEIKLDELDKIKLDELDNVNNKVDKLDNIHTTENDIKVTSNNIIQNHLTLENVYQLTSNSSFDIKKNSKIKIFIENATKVLMKFKAISLDII